MIDAPGRTSKKCRIVKSLSTSRSYLVTLSLAHNVATLRVVIRPFVLNIIQFNTV